VTTIWTSEAIEGSILIAGTGDLDADGRPELLAVEEPPAGEAGNAYLWVVH